MYQLLFGLTGFGKQGVKHQVTYPRKQQQQNAAELEVLCVCVYVCVCVCVCVLGREGSLVFASTALVISSMDGHVSHRLQWSFKCFCEQLTPPYSCHTGLKNV